MGDYDVGRLQKLQAYDRIIWYDADNNGIWSAGDHLWQTTGDLSNTNTDVFVDDANHNLLTETGAAGEDAADLDARGIHGVLVSGDNYGLRILIRPSNHQC